MFELAFVVGFWFIFSGCLACVFVGLTSFCAWTIEGWKVFKEIFVKEDGEIKVVKEWLQTGATLFLLMLANVGPCYIVLAIGFDLIGSFMWG